jgi:hypothetical protein
MMVTISNILSTVDIEIECVYMYGINFSSKSAEKPCRYFSGGPNLGKFYAEEQTE